MKIGTTTTCFPLSQRNAIPTFHRARWSRCSKHAARSSGPFSRSFCSDSESLSLGSTLTTTRHLWCCLGAWLPTVLGSGCWRTSCWRLCRALTAYNLTTFQQQGTDFVTTTDSSSFAWRTPCTHHITSWLLKARLLSRCLGPPTLRLRNSASVKPTILRACAPH
jgi:hypothetical protein